MSSSNIVPSTSPIILKKDRLYGNTAQHAAQKTTERVMSPILTKTLPKTMLYRRREFRAAKEDTMDFFSDHWLLWTCGFVPSMLYLGIGWIRLRTWERASLFDLFDPRSGHGRGPKPTMRAGEIATVLAWASGAMLVLAAIHVVVYAIFP